MIYHLTSLKEKSDNYSYIVNSNYLMKTFESGYYFPDNNIYYYATELSVA